MSPALSLDENLVRRLPLPLAQLCRRAHNANGAHNRHQAAYFLWEAGLKLLASVAVAEYAVRGQPDPALTERLTNLARPLISHWWEFIRLLVPTLADAGDEGFAKVRDFLLGPSRDDLPRVAGLDAALREVLDGTAGARSTVRLSELFDRMVRYRNRELAHGAHGLAPAEFYERMGGALLAGLTELFGRLDVLAGRRLVYIGEVRQAGGVWVAQRYELLGEAAHSLAPLEVAREQMASLPDGDRLYLEGPGSAGPRPLHPLLLYDAEAAQVHFLNARRGKQRTEYLCYGTGRNADRKEVAGAQQTLLAQILGMQVDDRQVGDWAARAENEAERAAPPAPESAGAPVRRVGEFEVFSELGRGGMGVVYRAWQPSLGRQVALKKLLRAGDPRTEARFQREIRALGKVEHPNLVKVFTSGSEGEDWFYAMELVEGADLADVSGRLAGGTASTLGEAEWRTAVTTACAQARQRERPLSEDGRRPPAPAHPASPPASLEPASRRGEEYITRVAEVVRQAAEAAHALHETGVVHRDIKPGNILLTPDGTHAVLMDLGLAQLADEMDRKLTRTREFVGTLRYASPEQVLAVAPVDRRSDVYSLGATLWELLTLRPLYGATEQTSSPELMQRIQTQEPEAVRAYNPRVSRDLDAIVLKCLEKDPKRRYATARDLADDLGRFLRHEPVQARPIGPVQRVLRRARRRPGVPVAVMLIVLGVAFLALFGYWKWQDWDAKHLKVEYYTDIVKRWGSPEGVGRISEQEAHHRFQVWRLTRRGGLVEKAEAVNGHDRPGLQPPQQTWITREKEPRQECTYLYRRNDRGEVIEEIALDRDENVVWSFHFSTRTTGYYADRRGIPRARGGSGAAFVEFVYTDNGFEREIHCLDRNGMPQANADGVFALQQDFDARGLPVAVRYLGPTGNAARHKGGYASVTHNYDDHGNKIEIAYLDEGGRPRRYRGGYARQMNKYDEHGNPIESACFDEAGRPTRDENGCAGVTLKYDERGNLIEVACFDEAGQPTRNSKGYSRLQAKFDDHGNFIEFAYFDEQGRPTRDKDGIARLTAEYDEHDNPTKWAIFDEADRPVRNASGVAAGTLKHDEHGNRVELAYFDESGRPTRCKEGYARTTEKYDDQGNRTEVAYFDEAGQATRSKDGYARMTEKVDERGNLVELAYFDEGGQRTRNKKGFARATAEFDDRGNQTQILYFDAAGQPTRCTEGYSRVTMKYDDRGKKIEQAFFDPAGRPTRHRLGYARTTSTYDDRGNLVEVACFDEAGQPTRHKEGYARLAWKYDDHDNTIEEAFVDEAGRPTARGNGYARSTWKRDERGNAVEQLFFDEAGRLARNKDGHAWTKMKYDARANMIEAAYFDETGRPARTADGYVSWTMKFDERGNAVELAVFDEAGRPTRNTYGYARLTQKFDERDHKIEQAFFDEAGQPTLHRDGYARWTQKYDERGNLIEQAYFDQAGRPTRDSEGCFKRTGKHDDRGNQIELAYFDEAGRPTPNKAGYACLKHKFDDRDQVIDEAFFDEAGHPTRHKDGYARATLKYDDRGNKTELAYFDEQGRPTRTADGKARSTSKYDDRGNKLEEAYFDEAGQPTRIKAGYARWTAKFDDHGNKTEAAFFDEAGRLLRLTGSCARWTAAYDDRGNQVEGANFDEKNQLVRLDEGYARWTAKYDDRDHRIEEAYFDTAGRPTRSKDGYARWTAKYDDRGNKIEAAYFDEAGRPTGDEEGTARLTAKYDDSNHLIERIYYDVDGKKQACQVLISEVIAGGQAQRLGVKVGDVVLSYDGQAMTDYELMVSAIGRAAKDQKVKEMIVLRGDKRMPFQCSPGRLGVNLKNRIIAEGKPGGSVPAKKD
jgi:YD repeat-containing protein